MNKTIRFGRLTNFQGRNGYFKQSGINVCYPLVPATLSTEHEIILTPITGKGKEGNCSMAIPAEHLPDFVAVLSAACSVPVKARKRFYLITLEERNGEQEYLQHALRYVGANSRKSLDAIGELVLRGWYEDGERRKKEDGGYYFNGGAIFVSVNRVEEISESDYLTLSKFI